MSNSEDSPIVVQIVTLGCAKNLVDAEVMCGTLASNGIYLTTDAEAADIMLINTCSFIRDARDEAEKAIRSALSWKRCGQRRGLSRAVAVGGCLPQRQPEACKEQFPEVDFFFGLDDIARIHLLIRQFFSGSPELPLPKKSLPTYLYDHNTPRITVTPENYAYCKIAEGCDHRCAFCAIPDIRGHLRSRQPESVLSECRQLLERGVREINFIAQDSTSYGRDLPGQPSLTELLQRCSALPGEYWLRVLYTHPLHVKPELLDLLAAGGHVVPYLDMPLQHISSHILSAMRRGQDGLQTRKLLQLIREKYPQIALRSTFLVGFPGETEQDFQELLAFIQEIRFERLGVFAYSPEENTPAMQLDAKTVPHATAIRRRKQLLQAQQEISLARNQSLLGQVLTVLPDEAPQRRQCLGRSSADAPEVDQSVLFKTLPGRRQKIHFAKVRITAADAYQLSGEETP